MGIRSTVRYWGGFHISPLPRFMGGLDLRAAQEALTGQLAMWGALQTLVVQQRDCSLELRFDASRDRAIEVFLLVLGHWEPSEADVAQCLELVERLIPKPYMHSRLSDEQLSIVAQPTGDWWVAQMERRSHFIDLPSRLEERPGEVAGGKPRVSVELAELAELRVLPDDIEEFLDSAGTTRYCLPLLGPLEMPQAYRRSLFDEMQASAPAIVSVMLHPLPSRAHEDDRQVANRLRVFLEAVTGALHSAGYSELASLQRVYDRYTLAITSLCVCSVKVAAGQAPQALAVVHEVSGWLGGMKGFKVRAPSRPVGNLGAVLIDRDLDFPLMADASSKLWEDATERASSMLQTERITIPTDRRYLRFLSRMPHIYTIDEASALLLLPYSDESGLPGLETQPIAPFNAGSQRYAPVLEEGSEGYRPAPDDRVRIGRINPGAIRPRDPASDVGYHWHEIPKTDLTKHALIVGSTGSGKTVTTQFLLRELARLNVPFLVIEPVKTEYYDVLRAQSDTEGVRRYRFEGAARGGPARDFLAFDPMRLLAGVSVSRHVSYLKSCFEAAFPLEAWQAQFLENGLLDYYLAASSDGGCGLQLFTQGGVGPDQASARVQNGQVYPSFATFTRYFLDVFLPREIDRPSDSQGTRAGAMNDQLFQFTQMFKRRFDNLSRGALGEAFRKADGWTRQQPAALHAPFMYLLDRPTVIELDGIPDGEQKALMLAFLLTFLFEARQADDLRIREGGGRPPRRLEHVLVLEEAHRLIANSAPSSRGENVGADARSKAVGMFVDMLAEIRAFGQGLVIVEQIPTKLAPEAVKNTNLKIMLRLTSRDDRDYLGEAMNFDEEQKRFVSTLKAEVGKQVQFVAFDESVDQPVLLSLPLSAVGSGSGGRLFDQYFVEQGRPRHG